MLAGEGSTVADPSPPLTTLFDLGGGCTTTVPLKDTLARTTISSTTPVQIQGYSRKVAAKVLLFIRTGRISLVGLTLQELGYLIYLADSLGVYGIIEAIQKKYDGFKPEKTDEDYKEAVELVNVSTVVSSINAEQLARSISFDYLVANPHLLESLWGPSMILLVGLLSPPHESVNESEELHIQLDIFKALLHWAGHTHPSESTLSQILNCLPGLDKVRQALPHPQNENYVLNEEIEEIYFGKILGNRYETVWNQWLEVKFGMDDEWRRSEMTSELGNIRARYLPDVLFENARSNNSTLTRAAVQDDFDWAAHYEEMEADEARETVPFSQNEANPPNAVVQWQQPKPRKMTLLKNALKMPFLKLKNRLRARNNR